MKHFTKLFIGILFLILGGTQSGFAQTTIDDMLLEKAVNPADVAGQKDADGNPVYVYLCNVTNKKFVHGGGEFGAQAVLSDRGIRFKVTKTTDGGYRLDKEADNITLSEIAKSVSNDYIHVTWHNGEDGREAIKDSKVEQAIDSIFVDLNEACDNLLKDKTIEDIMNISK